MGNAESFREGELVGGDVEAAVELYFVGVDDFEEGEAGGEVEREAGLAGASGPHDDEELVFSTWDRGSVAGGHVGPAAGPLGEEKRRSGVVVEVVELREQVETVGDIIRIEIEIRILEGVSWEGIKCHRN